MTRKYSKFFSAASEFNLDNFPYYWITQVHSQYVQNVGSCVKKIWFRQFSSAYLVGFKVQAQCECIRAIRDADF